jgi:hypothetical protein
MTNNLIINLIHNLDQLILVEQNIGFFKKNMGYYINEPTTSSRIFFCGKTIINCTLPNQGNIFGYPLSDNILKLSYNYCLKKKDESPFILRHYFKIFNNYYNIDLIKNNLTIKNNVLEDKINPNIETTKEYTNSIFSNLDLSDNDLNFIDNNQHIQELNNDNIQQLNNDNIQQLNNDNNIQELNNDNNIQELNNDNIQQLNNDNIQQLNNDNNIQELNNDNNIQELNNDNNIQELNNDNIQQLNNDNNNNNFVIENQANNIVDNNQHNSKPPYDINLYINNDKSLNVSSSSNDPNPPFLNSISSSSNDSVSSSSNLISSSSNDSASSSSNLIDTTTISESIDNEKIIFIGNVKIILNNNIITRMETEGNICSPNYPIISDEELKYYLKNGYSKNDKKNIFLYTFYYNLCKEKFYEIFTTKLFLLDKNFIEEFKIIVTFFNEDGFILNENILNWFIKNKLELQRKMFLSKIIQSKVPDKLEIFKKSDTDEYYETSEISIRITNIVFESKYSNKKNFHILYDSIDKFNLLNQVKEGLEVIIRKPK